QTGAVLTAARRATNPVLLIQRQGQLADVEIARLERQHRGATRGVRARPDLEPVDLLQSVDQRRRQLARALLDLRPPDRRLQLQRFAERNHRRFVALPESLERPRHTDTTRIRAEDARPDLRLGALVDIQHAVLFRTARPLVRAAAVEVRLDVAQVDV